MGLFKSKAEKAGAALEKVCRQSAEEANKKFFNALEEMKNGTADQTRRIRKLNELYRAAGYSTDAITDNGAAARMAYHEVSSGIVGRLYLHCLYTGIVAQKIQESGDSNLSEEALHELEHNDAFLNYIRPGSPAKALTGDLREGAENYILGGAASVKSIMNTDIELF